MQIGPYRLDGNLVLAPMAGVTDAAYRTVCLKRGAAWAVGEMAASGSHLLGTEMTRRRYACDPREAFPVVQIVGADPAQMAAAAALAEQGGAAMVDINFGCPARVVCGKACGSAVMRDPKLAGEILKAVAGAVSVPVSVKMRTGWDETMKTAVEIARRAQNEGFALVTVHGRTRAQRFSGTVNRADIAEVVRSLTIPVLANGDVTTPQQARAMLEETGAAGVMIGRGALGDPWIFERANALMETGVCPPLPPFAERIDTAVRQIELAAGQKGEHIAMLEARRHVNCYLKQQSGLKAFKNRICALERLEQLYEIAEELKAAVTED